MEETDGSLKNSKISNTQCLSIQNKVSEDQLSEEAEK